jgi:hypothetical protein
VGLLTEFGSGEDEVLLFGWFRWLVLRFFFLNMGDL